MRGRQRLPVRRRKGDALGRGHQLPRSLPYEQWQGTEGEPRGGGQLCALRADSGGWRTPGEGRGRGTKR